MTVTCKDCAGKPYETQMEILLPDKILEYLIAECKFTLSDQLVQRYWAHLEHVQDEWAMNTALFRQHATNSVWPLGFYGDEACIGLQGNPTLQIWGLWMNIILYRPRATRLSRFLLFAIESDQVVSVAETIFPVLQVLTTSFNKIAEDGVCGRRCLVAEIRGDQAFHRYIFMHQSWWRKTCMCFRCSARSDMSRLSYLHPECHWRATIRSTQEFVRQELPTNNLCALTARRIVHHLLVHAHACACV